MTDKKTCKCGMTLYISYLVFKQKDENSGIIKGHCPGCGRIHYIKDVSFCN